MEKKLSNSKILIVSHISDIDGMGSIVLGNLAFKKIDYLLIAVPEQKEALEFIKSASYEQIYICDIALDDKLGDEINELNLKISHFDHHQSNLYVSKYPFSTVLTEAFGHPTCGTELFYDELVKKGLLKPTPAIDTFVELIRSYDTWDWKKDNNLLAYDLSSFFKTVGPTQFIKDFTKHLKKAKSFAFSQTQELLINLRKKEVEEYSANCQVSVLITNFEGGNAGIVFCDNDASKVGNDLCLNNQIDFALMLNMQDNVISLRSIREFDVSIIAKKYGGGGHKNAAAFPLTKEYKILFLNLIVDSLNK